MDERYSAAIKDRVQTLYLADKIYSGRDLVKTGSWNAYCLAETSD
jgi:hypothetical protein